MGRSGKAGSYECDSDVLPTYVLSVLSISKGAGSGATGEELSEMAEM
jgi:hypothetical protein